MRWYLVGFALLAASCTPTTTLVRRGAGDGRVIYRLSETKAFEIARGAFAELLPDGRLLDITGERRGYWTTYRFGLGRYSQKVLVAPASGTDASGREVRGYWFEVSGRGTAINSRSMKNRQLFRRLRDALDATGTATVVTNVRDGRYETDGRANLAQSRPASETVVARRTSAPSPTSNASITNRLRELKAMREEKLISPEEHEAKRCQLLDRM